MRNEKQTKNLLLDSITACDALCGLRSLPDSSIDCCITSPPYYAMRDYEADGQIGLERSPDEYILRLVDVFAEVYRVLKPQGVMWVVIGDSYCGAGKGAATDPANAMLYKQGCNRGTLSRATAFKYETAAKRKDLLGIPWMLAFALRDFGWYLRQDIIWHKSNPMPESVTDRCTRAHEYVFLFSKRSRYYFVPMLEDAEGYDGRKATATRGSAKYRGKRVPGNSQQSIVQSGERWRFKNLHRSNPNTLHLRRLTGGGQELYPVRNRRDVWKLNAARSPYAHYATYPLELIEPCLLATCPQGGVVLDPFMGSGTTAVAAIRNDRHYIGFDINSEYVEIANSRITDEKSKKEIEL